MLPSDAAATSQLSRRRFLEFLGRGTLAAVGLSALPLLEACQRVPLAAPQPPRLFDPLAPAIEDRLRLVEGLSYREVLRWEQPLREGLQVGMHNDYLAFFPLPGTPDEGLLWVNHEYITPALLHRFAAPPKTRAQFDRERSEVGGSVVHVRKTAQGWQPVPGSERHQRVTATTPLPFAWDVPIAGSRQAIGTLGNCAGGVTPWGTVLTCEENYDLFWGERQSDGSRRSSLYGWENFENLPPEHYGWVVEIDPATAQGKKLIALGRCAHECATVHPLPDGRCVVYTGDDKENEFIYKFVSDQPNDLSRGTLYVANTETGTWLPLVWADQPDLKTHFKDQTEVLINLREAGRILGATPQHRPEDIALDPRTGHVFVSCTMNKSKADYTGHILRIDELGDYTSPSFRVERFLSGGPDTGFACPDNIAFDPRGGFWFTSDIAGYDIGTANFAPFGNNGLFYVPTEGPQAGQVLQVASAPNDAEFTGPLFLDGGRTLLLSVQHPGEESKAPEALTSHWPEGGTSYPRSCVVAISGPLLDTLAAV